MSILAIAKLLKLHRKQIHYVDKFSKETGCIIDRPKQQGLQRSETWLEKEIHKEASEK